MVPFLCSLDLLSQSRRLSASMHCSHHFDLSITTKYHILSFLLFFYKEVISWEYLKTLFADGEYPKFCDLWWNWWIQVQVDNFNGFPFCSFNSSQFFDWKFEIGIVNNLDPIRITRSKNSSSYTIKSIPKFQIFFKSSFTNQRHKIDNNRCSSNYSLSNWYSGVSKSCSKSTSTSFFLCLVNLPLSKHRHSTFMMILP